jgi:hypothetical protein
VLEGDQRVSLHADGDVELEAGGQVSVDGSLINLGGGA